ncbi:hypothetical protein BJ979_003426, partial [Schumannella luteola]
QPRRGGNAATATPAGSAAKWYTLNGTTLQPYAADTVLHWGDSPVASPTATWSNFKGSTDAEEVVMFLSKPGEERTITNWIATGAGAFKRGTKDVQLPSADLASLTNGNAASIQAIGGDYSVGIAFTKNTGTAIADGGVIFNTVHIVKGTDTYTFDSPAESTTPTDPPAGTQTASVDVSATTVAAQDGALELSVPAGAKATLGTAALVNGLSTSTGKLGSVTIKDGRVSSTPGWDLTSGVAKFSLTGGTSADDIDAKQLGVKPLVTSGPAAAAAGNQAGTAGDNKFASAAAGTSGTSVVDADLTFVAPAKSKAGTYTSKVTLTLVSK